MSTEFRQLNRRESIFCFLAFLALFVSVPLMFTELVEPGLVAFGASFLLGAVAFRRIGGAICIFLAVFGVLFIAVAFM